MNEQHSINQKISVQTIVEYITLMCILGMFVFLFIIICSKIKSALYK